MRRYHTTLLIALVALMVDGSSAAGQADPASAPAPAESEVKNPLEDVTPNPLTEVDPFAGEYEGDEVIVVVKVAGDGYVGEIRRAGRSFPLKAVREGKQLTGTFTHESTSFKFTAGFEGQTLHLTSGTKSFLLNRKDASAVVPLPSPTPAPPKPPISVPTPTPAPAPGPSPRDPAPKPKRAATPLPVDYARLSSQQLADAVWSRFPAGAFVVMEETATSSQSIGSTVRRKMHYTGAPQGVPVVRSQRWDGRQWGHAEPSAPARDECRRVDELKYTKGPSRAETITVAGTALPCEVTKYTGESVVKDGAIQLTLEVWRSRGVDHPAFMLDLPTQRMVVEPDIVRITIESDFKGLKATMDLKIETLEREVRVGDLTVACTVMKGVATSDQVTSKSVLTTEYWLSHQVPGGVVRKAEKEEIGQRYRALERNAVEFSQGK